MKLAAALSLLAVQTQAAIGFIEWWYTAWCDFGGMYGFRDFACGTRHPYEVLVPAGQRTQNTPGYSLDYKTYIGTCADFSQDCFFVGLRLFTPKPTAGTMVEMSFSVLDPTTMATDSAGANWSWDTVFCAYNYQDPGVDSYYGF